MRKITIFFALVLSVSIAIGQNLTQLQTLPNYPQLSILNSKVTPSSQIDFEQLAIDLEATATRTPDGQIRCFSNEYNEMLRTKYPQLGSDADFESWIAPKIQEYNNNVADGLATQKVVVTIPVIMHIIHNSTEGVGTGRNISQAQATSQITILNNDYRKLNSDTSLIPTAFKPLAADLEINFVPALRYASNHALAGQTLAEPGINRISAPTISGVSNTTTGYSTTFIDATIKPNTYWNRTEVMNIWVCQISGGILGYAQFPTGSGLAGLTGGATGANTDGLVLLYTATGTGGVAAAPYNKGRTATHEIGHWLGLRHIWGDEAACAADDYVTDTPQQKDKNYGCPSYPQTTQAGGRCSTGDPSSMYMNYMDYTDDACMMMFTQGQKARVVTVLANSPGRVELPTSTLGSPLATTAQFSGTPLSIPVGNSVTFTDQSISPNTITTWNWTFTGGTPSSFVGQTPPPITYSAAGNYTVSLTVTDNLLGTDNETKTAYINVFTAPTCDTLNYPPAGTIVAYTTGAGLGYVIGNNQYGDLAKAEYISSAAHAPYTHVTGGRFAVRSARDGGNGATVSFNIWDASGTGGAPGTVLGSVTVPLTALNTNPTGYENTIMQIMYPTAVNVGTAPYYFGFKMNGFGTGDTLGIFSNTSGDSSPGTAWEQQSDNIWYDVDAAWGGLPITSYLSPIMSQNAPGPVLTTNTTTICAGGSVNYNATTSTNTLSYSWVFNGGTPGTSTTGTQTVTYSAAGSPKTYLTLTGNCGAVSKDSVTITVNTPTTPTFTAVTPKCSGSTIAALPTTSNNGITGTWSPAINNTATTTYTFTPTAGQCATTTTMTITVNSPTVPTFTQVGAICTGGSLSALPTTSNNGITGTWSPALDNTTTTTYTFTPTAGQCATTAIMTITVNSTLTTPTFTAITPQCSGSTIAALPTTSNNSITGTWSPAINNTATTTYTFTPTAGQCASTTTMVITINPNNTVGSASSSPTVCVNTAISSVTHTTTGATGIGAASGLPAGVAANWSGNTITISGTPTASGTFNYSVPLTGGCGSGINATGTITVNTCVGIDEVLDNGIKIFPNPVNKLLTVQTFNSTVSQIKMINVLGELMINLSTINASTSTIKVEGFAKGIYFIQLFNNEGKVILTQKVIVN